LNFLSGGSCGCERAQVRNWEISALQDAQQLRADCTGRANDRDVIFFFHCGEL
jgi:hypothetical protein